MLEYIKGGVAQFGDGFAVIEVGGFGVKVIATKNTIDKLKTTPNQESGSVLLKTYLHISENKWEIFGFLEEKEREAFLLLLDCRGIGPKAALNILNSFSPARLRKIALGQEPVATLQQAQGIGAKSADRIFIELKEKLSQMNGWVEESDGRPASQAQYSHDDLYRALKNLGYRTSEIQTALSNISELPKTLSEAVKLLLKTMSRS